MDVPRLGAKNIFYFITKILKIKNYNNKFKINKKKKG